MKKVTGYVFTLIFVIFGFSGVAHAAATVTIGSQTSIAGAYIFVPITVTGFVNSIAGIDFNVKYDPNLFSYTGYTLGDAFTGHGNPTINPASGIFAFNWFDAATPLKLDSGTLVTLKFTVISSTSVSTKLIFTGLNDLNDINAKKIVSTFVDGTISINPPESDGYKISSGDPTTEEPNVFSATNAIDITPPQDPKPLLNTNPSQVTKPQYNFGLVTLKNGSKGDAVKELQRFLNDKLNLGLTIDGKLGPKTITVIKKWQKDHKLVADGLIGAKTKAMMNAER